MSLTLPTRPAGVLFDMDDVLTAVRDGALWITLNRPDAMNAITPDVLSAIDAALDAAASDDAIRSVVLTGSGDAGHDNRTVVNLARAYGVRAVGPDARCSRRSITPTEVSVGRIGNSTISTPSSTPLRTR